MPYSDVGGEGVSRRTEIPCTVLTSRPKDAPPAPSQRPGQRSAAALGQPAVEAKSNQIKVLPVSSGVASDRAGGNYTLALKGNPGRLRNDVQLFLGHLTTPCAVAEANDEFSTVGIQRSVYTLQAEKG